MKRLKRISKIFLILLLIALIKPLSAKALTYMDIYNSDDYFNVKEDVGTVLSRETFLKYGSSDQKTLGFPTTASSDWSYVSNNKGVWCLNHIANKTGGTIYIQDIITINGNSVTSDRYNSRKDKTDDPYDAAMYAFAMKNEPNTVPGEKGGHWTRFLNNWQMASGDKFYSDTSAVGKIFKPTYAAKTLSSAIKDPTLNMNQTTYAKSIENLYATGNFSAQSEGEILKQDIKDSLGTTWNYKITGLELEWSWDSNLVSGREIKIDGNKCTVALENKSGNKVWYIRNSSNTIVGRIVRTSDDKNGYILLKSSVVNASATSHTIEFTEKDSVIWARMYLIGGDTQQTRAITKGKIVNKTRSISATLKPTGEDKPSSANVSLQKYIIYKGENPPTINRTSSTRFSGNVSGRNNKIAGGGDDNTAAITPTITSGTTWKKTDNAEIINKGDYVTYKVVVYNNSNTSGLKVTIRDRFSQKASLVSVYQQKDRTAGGYTYTSLSFNDITPADETSYKYYEYTYDADKQNDVFLITLRYNQETTSKHKNKAWIYQLKNNKGEGIKNEAEGTLRRVDYDYVIMSQYQVSLQKYVSKVGDTNIAGRVDKQIYNESTATYKKSNPVKVKIGDTIEYTIKVKNNGTITTIVPTVTDTLPAGLKYISWGGDAINVVANGSTLTITVNNGTSGIAAGREKVIKIYALVDYSADRNTILENIALITGDKVKIGTNEAIDSTLNDNKDADYIIAEGTITTQKNVSLQKYITKIKNQNILAGLIEFLGGSPEIYSYGNESGVDTRSGYLSSATETNERAKRDVTPSIAKKTTYKDANALKIKEGSEVTYKIIVYNNESTAISNVKVTDRIPDKARIQSITKGTSTTDIKSNWTLANGNEYTYTISSLPANSSETFYITLKFTGISTGSGTLRNDAFLPDINGTYRTVDRDYVKYENIIETLEADVSLQKYIIGVSEDGGSDNISEERRNAYAVEPSKIDTLLLESDISAKNHKDTDISVIDQLDSAKTNKLDSKKEINLGDNVTYKIIVYNNKDVAVKVTVKDRVVNDDSIQLVEVKTGPEDGSYDTATAVSGAAFNANGNNKELAFNISLEGNEAKCIYVTLKFTAKLDNPELGGSVIENKAYIAKVVRSAVLGLTEADMTNVTTYRTIDADYVDVTKAIEYKVSLEKYVSSVSDGTGADAVDYSSDRKGKPEYAKEQGGSYVPDNDPATNNTYKKDKVVEVETGDIVTYDIIVKNDGTEPVKIVSIEDELAPQFKEIVSVTAEGAAAQYGNLSSAASEVDDSYSAKGITINNGSGYTLDAGAQLKITVKAKFFSDEEETVVNTAKILMLQSPDGKVITDTTLNDNADSDYIKTNVNYKVSLDKYVSKVNGADLTEAQTPVTSRKGYQEYKDTQKTKYNNVVTVAKGDKVTYDITVKNDGDTKVYIDTIEDMLPSGVKYTGNYTSSVPNLVGNIATEGSKLTINLNQVALLTKDQEITISIEVEVEEPNISAEVLTNTAEVVKISNRNKEVVDDITPDDNKDSDYIQLIDITISGMVWLDETLNKELNVYNGKYDPDATDPKEEVQKDIKVYLYRVGTGAERETDEKVAETVTDEKGEYTFKLDFIKGPKVENTNRWTGSYYSYYIVFEYNGIEYTSTITSNGSRLVPINTPEDVAHVTNASEDEGKVKEERAKFNERFLKINNESKNNPEQKLDYTVTENGHRYIYNPETMAIQSSTAKIDLEKDENLENCLKHVDLGIRKKDEIDLQLYSDVAEVEVTANGRTEVYNYSNIVKLKGSDVGLTSPSSEAYGQNVRRTDINDDRLVNKQYSTTGLKIKVRYRITVENASATAGKVTKVMDYFDKKYSADTNKVKAYYLDSSNEKQYLSSSDAVTVNASTGENYNTVIVTIPDSFGEIKSGETSAIFVELEFITPEDVLNGVDKLPTYNLAEIYEYQSTLDDNHKYMKGIIDKDSAPGTVATETARLTDGTTTKTTAQYYFAATDLLKLKFEDDTYAAPVLYLINWDNTRKTQGIVFVDANQNGKYDSGEKPIEGAQVTLREVPAGDAELTDEVKAIRDTAEYTVYTGADGSFEIKGFLPGEHTLEYYYGNNEKTLIIKDSAGKIVDSYNGYLYKSTKNDYESPSDDKWYLDVETGKSTATDIASRRSVVKDYTKTLNYTNTSILNAFYTKAYGTTEMNTLQEKTYMRADTAKMMFEVEKKDNENKYVEYTIGNMSFGIKNRPETVITLSKTIEKIEILDSTGTKTLASITYDAHGVPQITGDILAPTGTETIDISMEDQLLQGAHFKVVYNIEATQDIHENNETLTDDKAVFKKFVDYIPNNLSFNGSLDGNDRWELILDKDTYFDGYMDRSANGKYTTLTTQHSTMVSANSGNGMLSTSGDQKERITLETKLSSTNSTIQDIIASAENLIYDYVNKVELLETNSENDYLVVKTVNENGDIVCATLGKSATDFDATPDPLDPTEPIETTSTETTIHPPTGDSGIATSYYIIGVVSLAVLAGGVFGIKKFVIKK